MIEYLASGKSKQIKMTGYLEMKSSDRSRMTGCLVSADQGDQMLDNEKPLSRSLRRINSKQEVNLVCQVDL